MASTDTARVTARASKTLPVPIENKTVSITSILTASFNVFALTQQLLHYEDDGHEGGIPSRLNLEEPFKALHDTGFCFHTLR